jgi:hypothetical protein
MKRTHSFLNAAPRGTRLLGINKFNLARWLAAAFFCSLFAVSSVRASDPVGIYAVVDKVVLGPNEQSPDTIQVWGTFALAEGRGDTYSKPKQGYLFFKLDPEKPDVARKEWNDLKAVAGTRQGVAFGVRWAKQKPTVRPSDEKPKDPDSYTLGVGMHKIRDKEYAPVKALLEAAATEAKPKSGGEKKP